MVLIILVKEAMSVPISSVRSTVVTSPGLASTTMFAARVSALPMS